MKLYDVVIHTKFCLYIEIYIEIIQFYSHQVKRVESIEPPMESALSSLFLRIKRDIAT